MKQRTKNTFGFRLYVDLIFGRLGGQRRKLKLVFKKDFLHANFYYFNPDDHELS